jgi:hypothetical protein
VEYYKKAISSYFKLREKILQTGEEGLNNMKD